MRMSGGGRKLTAEQVLSRINDWNEREPEEPEPDDHSDSEEVDHRENQDDHYSESEQSTDAEPDADGIDEDSTYIGKGGPQFTMIELIYELFDKITHIYIGMEINFSF